MLAAGSPAASFFVSGIAPLWGCHMGKGSCRFLISAFLVATSFSGYLHAQQQQPPLGKIIGNIRVDKGDFPPNPILVTLEVHGAAIESVYSDGQGRFGFYSLYANQYRVTINDDAFQPASETVTVYPDVDPMNFVQFVLTPRENKKKQDPLPGRVGGSNPYLVDPAEYYRHFPKKTVKEFEKGATAEKQGKTEEAIAHYQRAISYSPDFYPAHNNLGSAYLSRQQFADAQNQFEAAIKANQNDPEAHFNLANVMLLAKRYDDATIEIEEGLKRQPSSAFGQFLRGILYSHTNRPELAEKSLVTALELDPRMSQAYLQLVNLYLQEKRTVDAINELQAYLKAFPDGPFSPKARDLLKRLQGNAPANR
jgi:tetratricopeptide (TPR) repeat protein